MTNCNCFQNYLPTIPDISDGIFDVMALMYTILSKIGIWTILIVDNEVRGKIVILKLWISIKDDNWLTWT